MPDQSELFAQATLEPLPLAEAELLFCPRIALGLAAADALGQLREQTPWSQESIRLYGKRYLQPRLTAWYGEPGARYRYSGKTYEPLPFTPLLLRLKQVVEQASAAVYNSVLLNYYRDGADAMGLHADDEPELGPEPCIASLSLGETREIYFRHKRRRDLGTFKLALPSSSLLVMRGATQANWKHGIRKLSHACGPRLNLTFRRVYAEGLRPA
ncbi:alpha-ketoglutarate-dependent dioxygenase AlkB [Seongchinamella sediminis]|uniref:Alpha-ketoglutarate-dependent dioxygenase AlkB n=1 Tax=Seongchinamella sediminis TaxID=2283635 RepID=A0A3L7DV76_9GAMM|nr:alpha-ketoglutarate-dependent dioxygenase AlkB [Seongchinamella sediminis]RLQ21204.1 alpha-ketoglutarate-dependent dioxygenase AlkB [Seongchinamella sediminis]